MPTLNDVYLKFGEVSEAAQLFETELGNILIKIGIVEKNLLVDTNPQRASELIKHINRQTLGQLLKKLHRSIDSARHLKALLLRALAERNRLAHSFYRQHNFRRNSNEGRTLMLNDLESIHSTLLEAYKAVMLLSGVDLDSVVIKQLPTRYVPI